MGTEVGMQPVGVLAAQVLFFFAVSLVVGVGYTLGRVLAERMLGK